MDDAGNNLKQYKCPVFHNISMLVMILYRTRIWKWLCVTNLRNLRSMTRMKNTQVSTAVSPSAFGALPVTELKMFTSTRNKVTSRAIRPGIVILFFWCKYISYFLVNVNLNTTIISIKIIMKLRRWPGTTSGGTMKEIHETMMNSPVVR